MNCGVIERVVEAGVVDQTLPADGRARLLEVGAHDDAQLRGVPVGMGGEAVRVVERGVGIVDRARPDDDEEPVVAAVEDVHDVRAGPGDGVGAAFVDRQLVAQQRWGQQRAHPRGAVLVQRGERGERH